jgi:hypothetical protein
MLIAAGNTRCDLGHAPLWQLKPGDALAFNARSVTAEAATLTADAEGAIAPAPEGFRKPFGLLNQPPLAMRFYGIQPHKGGSSGNKTTSL